MLTQNCGSSMMNRQSLHRDLESLLSQYSNCDRPLVQYHRGTIKVPGLLENANALCNSLLTNPIIGRAEAWFRATSIVQRLRESENFLQDWLRQWCQDTKQPLYCSVPVERFEHFRSEIDDETRAVFPSAFEFPSFLSAIMHAHFWACLLQIRSGIFDLQAAIQDELP